MHSSSSVPFIAAAILGAVACAPVALGQQPPDYGLDFLTIGAPGNRPTIPDEVPADPTLQIGAVGYTYRMMRDQLTVNDYLEFANAYAPFWQGDPRDIDLTGLWGIATQQPDGHWTYSARPGSGDYAAQITWEMAARYCNWLDNGKAHTAAAFENGSYDTSTFQHGAGWWTHQTVHNPGAQYWIPSFDEMTKAAYYDPNRYGPGQGGYWAYPNSSDTPLVMGLPGTGAETIGDLLWRWGPNTIPGEWGVDQYPDVRTPWGLIDVSATVQDFTSTVIQPYGVVALGGSLAGDPDYAGLDRIDIYRASSLWDQLQGFRIASAVPAPGASVTVVVMLAPLLASRRRR